MNKSKGYKEKIRKQEQESKIQKTLRNLYKLNTENIHKKNNNLIKIISNKELLLTAYGNLKSNKGSLTAGIDEKDTVDGFNHQKLEQIGNDIRNGVYNWKDIKQVEIPKPGKKKKRPLGLPTFSDKIVQEAIRIVLNAIYEPTFQKYELSHGSRPKRGTTTAINKLCTQGQGMEIALEGDIKGAFPSMNHDILLKILKKKISDKKFLELIYTSLKHDIVFKDKKTPNLIGSPQGSIASPILFNIYMHEFDMKILQIFEEREQLNKQEKRRATFVRSSRSSAITMRIFRTRKRLHMMYERKPIDWKEIHRLRDKIRSDKKLQIKAPTKNKAKQIRRMVYCRYVDNWIILTNEKITEVRKIKASIAEWFKNELKLELDNEKTHITDLRKGQAKFLGFTLFRHIQKVSTVRNKKTGTVFKRRGNQLLFIRIDHERVKSRMQDLNMITKKLKTRHVGVYCSLKPWEIVLKFNQKWKGFLNYYYSHLNYKSDLSFYYYIMKFSCKKTLCHRMRIKMSKIAKKYGKNMIMKGSQKTIDKKSNIIVKDIITDFPIYGFNGCGKRQNGCFAKRK